MTGPNATQWQDAIIDQICEQMFVAMGSGNVRDAFERFDVDGDGNITYDEFISTLKALDIGLSDDQAWKTDITWLYYLRSVIFCFVLFFSPPIRRRRGRVWGLISKL